MMNAAKWLHTARNRPTRKTLMKYKSIRSMAHNWAHSFMSGMNYVDAGFVFEDVYEMARARRGEKVVINWIPATSEELFGFSPRVRKCVLAYRAGLHEHLERHHIDVIQSVARHPS